MNETAPLISGSNARGSKASHTADSKCRVVLTDDNLNDARWLLYVSHLFNQFSEQSWQFCLAIFLSAFTNYESLILVTSYGLVTYSFIFFFGSSIGRYIDGTNRLTIARQFICLENFCVLTATCMCYILLSKEANMNIDVNPEEHDYLEMVTESIYDRKSILLLIGIHLLGAIAAVLDTGFLVAVERDWIVVMSICASNIQKSSERELTQEEEREVQKSWLSDTNVKMRQIDLSCKIVAPAAAGLFIALFDDGTSKQHGYDLRGAALLVGGVNVAALIVEYICTAKIYHVVPGLSPDPNIVADDDMMAATCDLGKGKDRDLSEENKTKNKNGWSLNFFDDLEVYFSQSICWAGFSLSLLYLNVALTFGNIMTGYLIWRGISMEMIGLWRGVASVAGLGGTFVYHCMVKQMSLVNVGMVSVVFQLLCLTACYVSLFVDNINIFFTLLISGVCFSRIGLWVFDISITQLMQLHIPAPVRGVVGGVQQSLNAFFTVIIYTAGLFISNPKYFYIYASISFAGVALAAVFYGLMVFSRKRIFHSNDNNESASIEQLKSDSERTADSK
jgi:iron-regulated transporter 1